MTLASGIRPFNYGAGDNCAVEWNNWTRAFEVYKKASQSINGNPDADWCSIFLFLAGPRVQQVYASLPQPEQEEGEEIKFGPLAEGYVVQNDRYGMMVRKLSEFFAPKRNKTIERHILRYMKQEETENIDLFIMRLRQQADRCEYDKNIDEFIKDQITEGCWSTELRKKILHRKDGTLEEILSIARIEEAVAEEKKLLKTTGSEKNGVITEGVNKIDSKPHIGQNGHDGRKGQFGSNGRNEQADSSMICGRCGFKGHRASDAKCPAKGRTCNNCGKQITLLGNVWQGRQPKAVRKDRKPNGHDHRSQYKLSMEK